MPFGRTMLIYSLISVTSTWTHSAFGGADAPVTIMPFASQPLVEAFCTIPSHLHFARAENGAVARKAFGTMISEDVLKRGIGKGTIDLWLQDLIPRNREFLQELMLDGVLVREGILDRDKIAAMISGAVSTSLVGTEDLVVQLYIESWLRRWMGVQAKAAA
jgi:asparagine synthase (glutamine-hydrolysing)